MATLEQTLAAVEAQRDEISSLKVFVAGLKKQVDDAMGGQLTPSQQMRLDQIFNQVTQNTEQVHAAIKANDGVTEEDEKAESRVEVSSSASPANVGDTFVLSAQITGDQPKGAPQPTGTVAFDLDGHEIGSGTLDGDGVAVFSVSLPLQAGDHEVIAHYSGDTVYRSSESEPIQQSINSAAGQGSDRNTGTQPRQGDNATPDPAQPGNSPGNPNVRPSEPNTQGSAGQGPQG